MAGEGRPVPRQSPAGKSRQRLLSRFAACSRASRGREIGYGGFGKGKAHRGAKELSISHEDSRTLYADTGSPGDKDVNDGSPVPRLGQLARIKAAKSAIAEMGS